MRLDLSILYWGLGVDAAEQLALAQAAERLGYETVWVAEAYGSDAVSMLAWLAAQTTTIGLGSAMFQIPARSAAATAMSVATLDVLSGGRMHVGIAPSGMQVAQGWHGVPFGRSIRRTREYVEIVRLALRGERLAYRGELYEVPVPGTGARPLKLSIRPVQDEVPVYLGGLAPGSVALAAEIADGWMPMFLSPEHHAERFLPHLVRGAERAGRSLSRVAVVPNVQFHIGPDRDASRDAMRPLLALYVGGMGPKDMNYYHRLAVSYGFADSADEVQRLYLAGRRDEAEAALSDELIDAVSLCGPADVVAERLAAYRAAGIERIAVTPAYLAEGVDRVDQLGRLAAIAAGERPSGSLP